MGQILQTDRILLREFDLSDIDDMALMYSDEEVMKYIGLGGPVDSTGTERMIKGFIESYRVRGFGIWGCVDKSTGRLIGHCGFNLLPDKLTEIAYLFDKPFWGKGFATSISAQVLDYGFNRLGLDEVVALAYPENTASIRVMQKIGMSPSGSRSYFGREFVFYTIEKNSVNHTDEV